MHIQLFPQDLYGVIVAKIMGCPSFITAHGMDINNFDAKSLYGHLISFSLNHCDKAIAVSENIAETMKSLGITEDKIVILRNAVDTERFKPFKNMELRHKYGIGENEILILFVGYLDTFKGIFELVNAFYEINKRNKNVKLMMVGTGPKKDELKKEVSKLSLNDFVIFTGKISSFEMHKYYQAADIFTLPSYGEGGGPPLVVLEAMSCGIPVVVTDVGGIPEIIEDGINGFVVLSKDKMILIQKLRVLITDSHLRNLFVERSIGTTVKMFSIDKKINKLIKLYETYI